MMPCPKCGTPLQYDVVVAVNPEQLAWCCPKCGHMPTIPPKPEPPPNRILRNYREIDPVTKRYKAPNLLDRWAYQLQDQCRRALRRLNWLKETGEWPVLCSNPTCIAVVPAGATLCDRHQARPIMMPGWQPVIFNQRNIQVNMLGDGYVDSAQVIRAIQAVLNDMVPYEGIRCDRLTIRACAGPYGLVSVMVTNQDGTPAKT